MNRLAVFEDPSARRIDQTLARAVEALRPLVGEAAHLEAALLLSEVSGRSRAALIAWPENTLELEVSARFEQLLMRRLVGEPIAYLRGRQAFWDFELNVTPATLIPRPETELLVETILKHFDAHTALCCLDAGTGSGAIAAALARERPDWTIIASERDPGALAVARANLAQLGLERVGLVCGDWLAPFAPDAFDLIVSNPPYIAATDPHLDQGDLRFEPHHALTPGGDGLDAIRILCAQAQCCLRPGGWLLVEHGYDQGKAVRALFTQSGFNGSETIADLAGLARVTRGSIARTRCQIRKD